MVWNNFFFYENSRPAESLNSREMRFQRQNRLQGILSRCPPSGTTDMPKGHVLSLPATHTHARERYREEAGLGGGAHCHRPSRLGVQAALPRELGAKTARWRRQRWAGRASRTSPTQSSAARGGSPGPCPGMSSPHSPQQQLVVLLQDTLPLVLLPMRFLAFHFGKDPFPRPDPDTPRPELQLQRR